MTTNPLLQDLSTDDIDRLLAGDHWNPHGVLAPRNAAGAQAPGVLVRAFQPEAIAAHCLPQGGAPVPLEALAPGLFAGIVPGKQLPMKYTLRFEFEHGTTWERADPYRFQPTLGDVDLHLINEGSHRRLWEVLGAHPRTIDGEDGVSFAVWAPNARRVSVVGDFCRWDGRLYPMRQLGSSGIYEIFIPGIPADCCYKYEIKTQDGALRLKADPLAQATEIPPQTASRVFASSYVWQDHAHMDHRRQRDVLREPMAIYELHHGSWMTVPEEQHRPLTYREMAERLVEHLKHFGFTHVELMPVAEHPFSGSWGYQVTGYYAPTARYGTPDDFKYFVDLCHRNGISVILDWVPAHFPRDDFALRRFDGTALYEHEDPRAGEHPDWGTLIFNYGRNEVRSFLISNALYWLQEYHIDGLRVDAVASMLYLDYSREDGQWLPNRYGGNENLEAIDFLRQLNEAVHGECPGCFTIAEESTAWGGVSRPVYLGGLGFTFKWNMGWMHDTLSYFSKDPIHRKYHDDQLTFAMLYEYSENFIMPLSHDEVVHGKGALLEKMPGDLWQKFANLRLLLAYQYLRPGKKLLFMGTELAPFLEWNHDHSLDWHLGDDPRRQSWARYMQDLGRLYCHTPCLYRWDHDHRGFAWIDCNDRDGSILSFARFDGQEFLVAVLNFTPVPHEGYRVGVPRPGRYVEVLNSDALHYGGSGHATPVALETEAVSWHGRDQSVVLSLPPLGAVVLRPDGMR